MTDEIIQELWSIKDDIAGNHGYDLDSLSAYLRNRKRAGNQQFVNLQAVKTIKSQGVVLDGNSAAFSPDETVTKG